MSILNPIRNILFKCRISVLSYSSRLKSWFCMPKRDKYGYRGNWLFLFTRQWEAGNGKTQGGALRHGVITSLWAGKSKLLSNHSTTAVTAVLTFRTAHLLVWYCLNNQVYSLSVTGNDTGPSIYPWGTSLLQKKMICKKWKRWAGKSYTLKMWSDEPSERSSEWTNQASGSVFFSLCNIKAFQREEAFRYPGVRLSALFWCSLRPDAQWHSTDSSTETLTQSLTPLAFTKPSSSGHRLDVLTFTVSWRGWKIHTYSVVIQGD